MSEATIESLESEAYEGEGGEAAFEGEAYGESGYEGEAYGEAGYEAYSEDARSDARRRRARQQRIVAARQRQARQRRAPAPPPRRPAVTVPSQRQAMPAIRSLDLDTKAELDSVRRQLAKARRNGDMAMYSAVLSTLASQGIDTFGDKLQKHDVVKSFFRTAPLALLWPQSSRRGIEGILLHPAFVGAAGVAAIVISGKLVNASQDVHEIQIANPGPISAGDSGQLSGTAKDRSGRDVQGIAINWDSDNSNRLNFTDKTLGKFTTGPETGPVNVKASTDGVSNTISVTITKRPDDSSGSGSSSGGGGSSSSSSS
jgi:hypothetical protein